MKIVLNKEELKEYRTGLIAQEWSSMGPVYDSGKLLYSYYGNIFVFVYEYRISAIDEGLKSYIDKNRNIITNNLILEKLVKKYNDT